MIYYELSLTIFILGLEIFNFFLPIVRQVRTHEFSFIRYSINLHIIVLELFVLTIVFLNLKFCFMMILNKIHHLVVEH